MSAGREREKAQGQREDAKGRREVRGFGRKESVGKKRGRGGGQGEGSEIGMAWRRRVQ